MISVRFFKQIVCEECGVLLRCKLLFLILFTRHFLKIQIRQGFHSAFSEAIPGWQKEQNDGIDGWYRGCL